MVTQQMIAPPARAAMFLVLTVNAGSEGAVRDLLADVSGLTRSVSFRKPDDELNCVIGIGSDLWGRLFAAAPPRLLHPFVPLDGPRHSAPSTPGDLLVHLRARHLDVCFELARQLGDRLSGHAVVVDETHGFKYFDERDLLGFVDGTENPEGDAAQDAVLVGAEDPDYAGGTYVIVQKYLHDMAAWSSLSVEEQERVIGRTKLDDIELADDVKPANSHVALNTILDADGVQRQIVRDNMPFGTIGQGEFGTYFIGYAADPGVIELMLERMFLGDPPGNTDRILDFSTARTGSLFFAPPLALLDDPPPLADGAAAAAPSTPHPATPSQEGHDMDNLHRSLAPISSAAWAQIDDEARRTFATRIAGRRVVDSPSAGGVGLSAVGSGHLTDIEPPIPGVEARQRRVQPLVELRVPFEVTRAAVDDVDRGAEDSDWQGVKDAVESLAAAEDTLVFDGSSASAIEGIATASSNDPVELPASPGQIPDAVAKALTTLRTVGVQGPYALVLSAELYTLVAESSHQGYPVVEHLRRLLGSDGDIVFAPALTGAVLVSRRGGDYTLTIGEDVSIGYLSHDADTIRLYAQESLTFQVNTAEASVVLR